MIDLWEVRKVKMYGEPCLSLSPQLGIRGMALCLGGREEVSLVSSVTQGVTGKLSTCTCITDDASSSKTGSACTRCVVNGRIARAAS